LILNYKSFFGALITSIIIISIFIYSKKKEEIREQEKEKKRKREEKENRDRLIKEHRDILKKEQKEYQFNKQQNAKGLYKYEDKWGTKEQIEKWNEIKYGINQNFKNMTPYEFEEFIAKLFRNMGYDAHTTKKTGDYGIDVIAKKDGKKIAIQCKQNQIGNNVGNVVVQKTLGSMWKIKADKSIIITTSDFTTQAEEQAKEAPIELWDRHYLKIIVKKYLIEMDDH
jgi:restriction system protein